MKHYSFFHKETGALHPCKFSTDDDSQLANNVPPDHIAIDGHHDHMRKRVNVETKEVIDYQPPAPSAEHVWDEATKTWNLNPAAMAKIERRRTAYARIAILEASSMRPLREHALGLPGADQKLKDIDAEIAALRSDLKE
jgi:hypothetical protein